MTKEIRTHLPDYLVLMIWLTIGLWGLSFWRSQTQSQWRWLVLICLGYVGWGIWHHWRIGDLNPKIVLEYGLIALLIMVLITAVMNVM